MDVSDRTISNSLVAYYPSIPCYYTPLNKPKVNKKISRTIMS